MSRINKALVVVVGLALLCPILAYHVVAAPTGEDGGKYLFRIEVQESEDHSVSVSVPLSILDVLIESLPERVKERTDKSGLTADTIRVELEKLHDEDLVRIEGDEQIRIWLEPVEDADSDALQFIRVNVREGGDGHEIKVCVPVGLIRVAAGVAKELGLIEKIAKDIPVLGELEFEGATKTYSE